MRTGVGFLMVLATAACGRVDEPALDARGSLSSCAADADCDRGMICAACPDGAQSCVPGCRETSQCPQDMVCLPGVACLSCPCPPGWCDLDPCRDLDEDGYAFTSDPNIACPGKEKGDCNDSDARVHPGAKEYCTDWIDNDCNRLTDRADPACRQCANAALRCSSPADCAAGGAITCENGCCTACPSLILPDCAGECVLPGPLDPVSGCLTDYVCGACAGCSPVLQPVCGTTYATYTNECQARAAGASVLHQGNCQTGEGLSCNDGAPGSVDACPRSTYCRDLCQHRACVVKDQRCTQVGVCETAADCPAGLGLSFCANRSPAPYVCESHRCVPKCP